MDRELSASSDPAPAFREAIADRYVIERELGRGGMAVVYLALDLKHKRLVAVKVLDPQLSSTLSDRFLREIQIAAGLTQPHILPIHDSGEAGGYLYYVMPYVDGESLRDRLDREHQLPIYDALRIAHEVASALDYALGVTSTGEKRILGLVQTASENKRVIAQFLRELGERGFPLDQPMLVVLDGSKGLRAAVSDVLGDVPVQRCQWHKRENVVSYLAKQDQPAWRRKLQAAYAHTAYADAKRALERLYKELRLVNESAAASLAEGLEETLTLHRLNVYPELGVSFKTTNLIESVMSRLEAKTRRVTHWRTSDQKLRWCASALWAMEKQFRRIKNHRHLPLLKQALQNKMTTTKSAAA